MRSLCVAIPDSSLSDEQTRRDKTIKAGQFARAFSIFRVAEVIIYHDKSTSIHNEDLRLLQTLLEFLDTPQYLRKRLYPLSPLLQYSGLLHPIKAPHHKSLEDVRKIKMGERRTGVLVNSRGALFVDIGLGFEVPFIGKGKAGEKVIAEIVSGYPDLKATRSQPDDAEYGGYTVKTATSLRDVFSQDSNILYFITSRKGASFSDLLPAVTRRLASSRALTVVFGSPKRGVDEIMRLEGRQINQDHIVANMFPAQGTETVRLEEAVLGTLAILNALITIRQ